MDLNIYQFKISDDKIISIVGTSEETAKKKLHKLLNKRDREIYEFLGKIKK